MHTTRIACGLVGDVVLSSQGWRIRNAMRMQTDTKRVCPMFGQSRANTSPLVFEVVRCSRLAETAQCDCVYLRDGIANAQRPEATNESFHSRITHPK